MIRFKLFVIAALLTAGTFFSAFVFLADQLKGNGNVTVKQREVAPFSKLELDGIFNVFLSQGDKEAMKVETDENLQDVVETVQENQTLRVQFKKGVSVKHSTKMNVYITLKEIEKLKVDGVGNVETTSPITLNNLDMTVSGVGNTSLELTCKKLDADVSGVGSLKLKGAADEAKMNASGVGDIEASGFKTKKLTADVSGVGDVELNAGEEITISSSGIGNVSYTGGATVKKMKADGIGKVKSCTKSCTK